MLDSRAAWGLVTAAIAVCALWLGVLLRARWQRWRDRLAGQRYLARGLAAEREAERLLEREGFVVTARQAQAGYELSVDGERRAVHVCADLLVHDGRETWVAEVKTGERGRRVNYRGTRRQLLEYQLAFGVGGVVLVDPEEGRLDRVQFPFGRSTPPPAGAWRRAPLWVAAGALLASWRWLSGC